MNTSKDHLEVRIKKQIGEREIAPSRDLWSEIELQNTMNNRPKSKMNWVLAAACLILMVSLGTVLFFLNEPSENKPQVVVKETVKSNDGNQVVTDPEQNNLPLAVQDNEKQEVKKIAVQQKEELSALAVDEKKLILKEHASDKKPLEPVQISNPKMIAKIDSAKIPVKKKKYVDPSTLLFSVEHKDVIEKTKDGSNVATIELNRK